jgi:hypothetical protein
MSSLVKKIEVTANVAIIVVAVLLGVVLIRSFYSSRPRAHTQETAAAMPPGTRLPLSGFDWKTNDRTLILALSTQCHFCTDSASFYQRVAQQRATTPSLRVLAVLPQPIDESREYLKKLGVTVDEIKQLELNTLGVNATPTIIVANNEGVVTDSWRGKLTAEKEAEVLSKMK